MISIALVVLLVFLAAVLVLLIRSHSSFTRILLMSLFSALVAAEIVLYAVYTGEDMYLDVALVFALLGFMDVQFFAVYLRKKGGL